MRREGKGGWGRGEEDEEMIGEIQRGVGIFTQT